MGETLQNWELLSFYIMMGAYLASTVLYWLWMAVKKT